MKVGSKTFFIAYVKDLATIGSKGGGSGFSFVGRGIYVQVGLPVTASVGHGVGVLLIPGV